MSIVRAQLSIKFSVERLRVQTKDLADQQFPGDHHGPRRWLRLVNGLLDTADEYLLASQDLAIPQDDQRSRARDAARLASAAYQTLGVMRGATIDELPYPMVPPLQRWFDQLGITNTTLFRSELVANYELKSFDEDNFKRVRNPSKSLEDAMNVIEWPVLRVTVPSKAFAILPHFAIVAHEIGHALYPKINWDLSGIDQRAKDDLIGRICGRLGVTSLDQDTGKMLLDSFDNWFEELAADAFALFLTGPAILFSLSDFFQLLGGSYGLCHTHPANDLRRKILFDAIFKGGDDSFVRIFEKYSGCKLTEDFNSALLIETPHADDVYADMLKIYGEQRRAAVLAELHAIMPKVVSIIYSHVEDYLKANAPNAIYTPERYEKDLSAHLENLLAAIPPIEIGDKLTERVPAEFASILNVGWVVLLTKLPELRVRTDDDLLGEEKLERLQGLLLKAVELSESRRLWEGV